MRKITWIIVLIFLFVMFVAACGSSPAPAEQEKWAYIQFGRISRVVKLEKAIVCSSGVLEIYDAEGEYYRIHQNNVVITSVKPE